MNYERTILTLLERVAILEEEVKLLNNRIPEKEKNYNYVKSNNAKILNEKDKTKYILDGKKYGKGRLVLATIKKYMKKNPNTSAEELKKVFDKSLQGSLGVIQTLDEAKQNCPDYRKRFYTSGEEMIFTSTEKCVVCTQWGIVNIGAFLLRANQLGIDIETIK